MVWPADRPGTVRELAVPAGADDTYAFDVDDDGTVVGYGTEGEFDGAPYVWPPNGAPYPLPRPAGFDGDFRGTEISNGWVAGSGERERDGQRAGLLWNLRDQTVQVSSAEFDSYTSVNRSGVVGARGAIIHPDGRIVRLRADGSPRLITDNGDAAGTVTGLNVPVVWSGC